MHALNTLFVAVLIVSLPAVGASADIAGRYSPVSVDAGVMLSLAADGVFSADWWAQDMKSGKILRDTVSGSWKSEEDRVVLRFDAKNRKGCVAEFRRGELAGKGALILVRPSEFPLSSFFGDTYYREEKEPNKAPLRTPGSVTPTAGAPVAPQVFER
jgi:hypothetical protein